MIGIWFVLKILPPGLHPFVSLGSVLDKYFWSSCGGHNGGSGTEKDMQNVLEVSFAF